MTQGCVAGEVGQVAEEGAQVVEEMAPAEVVEVDHSDLPSVGTPDHVAVEQDEVGVDDSHRCSVSFEAVECRSRTLLHLPEETPVLGRHDLAELPGPERGRRREHGVGVPAGELETGWGLELLGDGVQARQRLADLVHGTRTKAAPRTQDASLHPREEVTVAPQLWDFNYQLAVASGDRPRHVGACTAQLLVEHLQELQLGTRVRDAPESRPVHPKGEAGSPIGTLRSDLEDGVVGQPDRSQGGIRRDVVRARAALARVSSGSFPALTPRSGGASSVRSSRQYGGHPMP